MPSSGDELSGQAGALHPQRTPLHAESTTTQEGQSSRLPLEEYDEASLAEICQDLRMMGVDIVSWVIGPEHDTPWGITQVHAFELYDCHDGRWSPVEPVRRYAPTVTNAFVFASSYSAHPASYMLDTRCAEITCTEGDFPPDDLLAQLVRQLHTCERSLEELVPQVAAQMNRNYTEVFESALACTRCTRLEAERTLIAATAGATPPPLEPADGVDDGWGLGDEGGGL